MTAPGRSDPQPTDSDADDLEESGQWGDVRHAKRANGHMEAKEWLRSAPESVSAKFAHLFRRMCAFGQIHNEEHFRPLGDGIYEFKRDADRILCFQHGKCWRLTHHYPKGKRKCPPSEIERAKTIRTEFFEQLKARQ